MLLNYIWIAFFIIGGIVALVRVLFSGDVAVFNEMSEALFAAADTGFKISLGLAGVLTLWQGLLNIAEKSKLTEAVAHRTSPFFHILFPSLPKGHPVVGTMLMNFSANLLGLDNAATPLGLQTMRQLQELNSDKEKASDAMIMFICINASGLTLIPITIIMYRMQMGSTSPADIFLPILLSTGASTLVAILLTAIRQRINLFKKAFLVPLSCFLVIVALIVWWSSQVDKETLTRQSALVSNLALIGGVIFFVVKGMLSKRNVYEDFIDGAKDGFNTAITIIPYIVAILVGVSIFRSSGAMDWLLHGVSYMVSSVGLDTSWVDALPTMLMKPLSGSGARGLMIDAMQVYGADSFVGRLVSMVQGSCDTTFYILALYYGSVAVKNTRYTLGISLISDLVGMVVAVTLAYTLYL